MRLDKAIILTRALVQLEAVEYFQDVRRQTGERLPRVLLVTLNWVPEIVLDLPELLIQIPVDLHVWILRLGLG